MQGPPWGVCSWGLCPALHLADAVKQLPNNWLAVKDFKLSYHMPKTSLSTPYPDYGNFNLTPEHQPRQITEVPHFTSN